MLGKDGVCLAAAMFSVCSPLSVTRFEVEGRPLKTTGIRPFSMLASVGFDFPQGTRATLMFVTDPNSLFDRRSGALPFDEVQVSGRAPVRLTSLRMAPIGRLGPIVSMPGISISSEMGVKLVMGLQGPRPRTSGPSVRAVIAFTRTAHLLGLVRVIRRVFRSLFVLLMPRIMIRRFSVRVTCLVMTWLMILADLLVVKGTISAMVWLGNVVVVVLVRFRSNVVFSRTWWARATATWHFLAGPAGVVGRCALGAGPGEYSALVSVDSW